jgi:isopenicillin-N epimerase
MELVWRSACESRGARYLEIDTRPSTAADALLGAFTPRTRALFVSHISSPTALRFPVEELCTKARAAGVLTVVDGAHAPGQIALDVAAIGADFYTGNCHKWLCAPKGAGFLYVRPESQAQLEPPIVSWDWPAQAWADRFRWTGTHDPTAHLAVPAAIDFQAEHAWDEVRSRCHDLAARAARDVAELLGTEPFPENDGEFAQMVSVRLPPCDAEELCLRLAHERRIEVAAQTWRGEPTLRVSFQGYNGDADLEALLEALPGMIRACAGTVR